MKTIRLLIIVLIIVNTSAFAQTISDWRMDNRTGVSSETGLLKSWPEAGPEMIWSTLELPKGYSSVSFSSNAIFLTGIEGQNDVLVALDTLGKLKWKTIIGRAWNASFPESRSTPTVEGNKVFVTSGFGDLACIDATSGLVIWSTKASEIYKGTYGNWGIAESLLIDGDQLYFTPGGPETTTIALNKNTGSLIWKSASLNDNPGYVSPILITYSGKRLIVNVTASYVFGIDPSTGAMVWKFKHLDINKKTEDDAKSIKCVSPIYHDGKIYVTGGYDHGSFLLNLTNGGNNVSLAWTDETLDVHHGGVVLLNGYIYGSNWLNNGNGNWCCLDWNTGKKMYEEHWKCKGSIIAAEGLLYLYDEKTGFVALVRPTPEKFDLISSFKISDGTGPHWAHPVIHHGNLYVRHGSALMAFRIMKK